MDVIPKDVLDYCQERPGCKGCNICDEKPNNPGSLWIEGRIEKVRIAIKDAKNVKSENG